MGGDEVNPESEINTNTEFSTPEITEVAIGQATEKMRAENNQILNMDKAKEWFNSELGLIEYKAREFSQNAKEFFKNITWRKAAVLGSTAALAFVLVCCTDKSAETSSPAIPLEVPQTQALNTEVSEGEKETQEIKKDLEASMEAPEEKEQPPEVDLGWHNWMTFDIWGGSSKPPTEEEMEERFNPESRDGPIYMFFTRDRIVYDDKMMFALETTTPDYNPGWDYVEAVNDDTVGLSLNLNEVEKEILKQYILFRQNDGKNTRLFLFIDEKKEGEEIRCMAEKEGALVVIEDLTEEEKLKSEDGKDFKVNIYDNKDIPWYELPYESWKEVGENKSTLDLRKGQIHASCDIDDIRAGVTK